ncbi:MAG: hypothetical protein AAF430_02555 [Myxococcota bacterium]
MRGHDFGGVWIGLILGGCTVLPGMALAEESASVRLDRAWQSFHAGLAEARDRLENREDFPPEPSDRNLAEGYRYLLGHVVRMAEAELRLDPRFPEFHRSVDMLRKHTGENPDAMYLKAPIDGTGSYRIRGRVADTREWRSSERHASGPKAPRLVTFQTITDIPGNTGELAEMGQCASQTLGFVNSFEIEPDASGEFEIRIGPKRPKGYDGLFLPSRKQLACAANQTSAVRDAKYVAVREIFSDWEHERPLELEIERLDSVGASRPPITPEQMAEILERLAVHVPNHIRFWSLLQEFPLEVRRDANGDGVRNLPVNGMNEARPPFTAGGAAGSKQLYASGVFELAPDQALVIRVETPKEPHYIGFQLNNFWMEGPDQQNYTSSRTGQQLPPASDGARYYVVSHRDPGVPGWVATTGLPKGFHTLRLVYRDDPDPADLPTITTHLGPVDRVSDQLPDDTPVVTVEARRAEVAVRQAHIKQRWRAY